MSASKRPGELLICAGNTALETTMGVLELGRVLGQGRQFSVRLCDSEFGGWVDLQWRTWA